MNSPFSALPDLSQARVLIVDDVADNRELLVRRLHRLGIQHLSEAENGQQALACLDKEPFDLLLLDIMMPVMNGHQVLQQLSEDGRIHHLPVIVISALNDVDDIAACIEAGAEDFLLKPFNRTLLRARVLSCLEKKFLRDQTRLELQRKQAELTEARTLQLALAPEPAQFQAPCGDLAIDLILDPAREVGGDLVDYFPIEEDLLVMAVGDVSDKGAGSALMMARSCALLRSLASRPDAKTLFAEPEHAMAALNAALTRNNPSCMFVTLLLACLDLKSGCLRYVRAGHVPPFLRYADGRLVRLDAPGGVPPGVLEDAPYVSQALTLSPGDQLLIITDGITEASTSDGQLFGDANMTAWLTSPQSTSLLLSDLIALVRQHEAGMPPSDDVAALLFSFAPLSFQASGQASQGLYQRQLQAQAEPIARLLDEVEACLGQDKVDGRCAQHAGLILDELLSNIAHHSPGPDKTCKVELWLEPDHLRLIVEENGPPFDLRSLPPPDTTLALEARTAGGLGAHLVLTLAQHYDYSSTEGRNTTTLVLPRYSAAPQA